MALIFRNPALCRSWSDGEVIGAIRGVSSADDAEKCAQAAIDVVFKKQRAAAP